MTNKHIRKNLLFYTITSGKIRLCRKLKLVVLKRKFRHPLSHLSGDQGCPTQDTSSTLCKSLVSSSASLGLTVKIFDTFGYKITFFSRKSLNLHISLKQIIGFSPRNILFHQDKYLDHITAFSY